MKYDIVSLLSAMLNNVGLSDVMDQNLSNHATISLNMKGDIPTIHIKTDESGQVWVWSKLCEYNITALSYSSANLFPLMFSYNEEVFYCGQPCLYPVEGNLELRAQIKNEHLESPEAFLVFLDHYLTFLQDYRMVLV